MAARQWGPSELRCIESDWEGLPAQALFKAVNERRTDDLDRLLSTSTKLKYKIDEPDGDSFCLLHHLATYGSRLDVRAIEVIIHHGGDVNVRTRYAETPLVLAAIYGNLPAAKLLLRAGARVDLTDTHGNTALSRAREPSRFPHASNSNKQAIARLIETAATAVQSTGEAEALRAAGNKAFGAGKFEEAIDAYTKSIAVREDTRTFSNRSACWIKLGVAEYQSRRKTAGKSHQICDGVSKVVRWVPDASPSTTSPSGYYPFCDGNCPNDERHAYRCRSVEIVTEVAADLFGKAVEDASRAAKLDPNNAKAHFRWAKANIGKRDFPRARICLEKGVAHCPDNAPMKALLKRIIDMGVGTSISNPFNPVVQPMQIAGGAAVFMGAAHILCAYCTFPIPGENQKMRKLMGEPAREPDASKEQVLKAAGYPQSCPMCACNPCVDVDQRAVQQMIEE